MKAEIKERIDKINRGQVPEGYKKTREGIIPCEWKIEKLGKYVTIHSGDSPSKFKFCSTGVSYFKVDDLNNCDKYLANSELKIDEKDLKKIVPKNSLIFPKRGASILTNKVRILKENSFFDTNLMGIEPNEEKINYEFLYYLILEKRLYKIADTSTIPQLNNKHIEPLLVVLPNVSEQKRIAQVLSTWDKAIELKEKLIEQKKEQKKGLMQRLLTGKVRLPGFEGEWKEVRLGEIGECIRGVSYQPKDLYTTDVENSVRLLRSNNILDNKIIEHEIQFVDKSKVKENQILRKTDIVISMANGSKNLIGKNAEFRLDATGIYTVGSFCAIFRFNQKVESGYAKYLFQTERYEKYVQNLIVGSNINNLKPTDIESMSFRIPSDVNEQKVLASIIDSANKAIELLEREVETLKQQKKGLMQLLLTGKVRVKC